MKGKHFWLDFPVFHQAECPEQNIALGWVKTKSNPSQIPTKSDRKCGFARNKDFYLLNLALTTNHGDSSETRALEFWMGNKYRTNEGMNIGSQIKLGKYDQLTRLADANRPLKSIIWEPKNPLKLPVSWSC